MQDQIIHVGKNVIQHGPLNDRVYIMKVRPGDELKIIHMAEALAKQHQYTKIFAKLPALCRETFIAQGYVEEASMAHPDRGMTGILFMSRFLEKRRKHTDQQNEIDGIIDVAMGKGTQGEIGLNLDHNHSIAEARPEDAEQMAELYSQVFPTYPFPIDDPAFLRSEMGSDTRYFLMRKNNRLIGASSAEQDFSIAAVEMTDFAVLPEFRGQRLAEHLLRHMERALTESPIQLAFTIARAISYGMNITFTRSGYQFGGTLINNTNISGSIESMNTWYKPLQKLKTEGSDHAIAHTHK